MSCQQDCTPYVNLAVQSPGLLGLHMGLSTYLYRNDNEPLKFILAFRVVHFQYRELWAVYLVFVRDLHTENGLGINTKPQVG